MEAERPWYYLQHSRQLGPCTWNELQDLLATNVISPATLVWRRGGAWRTIEEVAMRSVPAPAKRPGRSRMLVVGALIFCTAMSFRVELPRQGYSGQQIANFFPLRTPLDSTETLNHIADPVLTSSVNGIVARETATPAQTSSMLETARKADLNSGQDPQQRSHLVQEYWRAISYSKVIGRYEYYLRRAPASSFAQIAAERIEELRQNHSKEPAVRNKKRPAAKPIVSSPKLVKISDAKSASQKLASSSTEGRCWTRNMEACRRKCRAGDRRACQKLKRIGG